MSKYRGGREQGSSEDNNLEQELEQKKKRLAELEALIARVESEKAKLEAKNEQPEAKKGELKSNLDKSKERISYSVELIDQLPVSVFKIDNADGSLSLDKVQQWFRDKSLVPPKCTLEDNQIKVEVSYQWTGKAPYHATILAAIIVFKDYGIELTEEAKESLFQDMIEAEVKIRQLRLKYSINEEYFISLGVEYFPVYLKSFYGLFVNVENVFGAELAGRAKDALSNKDSEIKAEIIENKLLEIFLHSSTVPKTPGKPDALASIVITSNHWDAFGGPPAKGPELANSIRKIFTDQYQDASVAQSTLRLDVTQLNDDTRTALQNLLAHTAKLQSEFDSLGKGKKKDELGKKLTSLKSFIKVVLEKDKLTPEVLKYAYLNFERLDVNRGTGLYRIRSAFYGKSFLDQNNKKRYVKSTAGELVYNLMEAVKAQEKEVDLSELDDSQKSSGKRG